MKTRIFILTILLAASTLAQVPPSIEDPLTALWKQKKYTELATLLDAKASSTPPDVVALYCSKVFYVFIQPNKQNALSAATKLKTVAEATGNAGFVAFAQGEITDVQSIPDADFAQAAPEALAILRTEFVDRYPNVEIGTRLRKFLAP